MWHKPASVYLPTCLFACLPAHRLALIHLSGLSTDCVAVGDLRQRSDSAVSVADSSVVAVKSEIERLPFATLLHHRSLHYLALTRSKVSTQLEFMVIVVRGFLLFLSVDAQERKSKVGQCSIYIDIATCMRSV